MWNWIKNLFSSKEKGEEEEKINKELRLSSASDAVSSDGKLRFRFQLIGGKYNLIILTESDRLYHSVYGETTVEGNTGKCYLKIDEYNESFKILTGIFSCRYPYTVLTVEDINLSDFLEKDFTKCRIMSRTYYVDSNLDVNDYSFNKKLKAIIKDLLNRYEILTTNPTKDL